MHAKNTALLARSVFEYWRCYFGSRRFPDDQQFYVVYTSLDHVIPFQPDSALDYWLVNLKFAPASVQLGGVMPAARFREMRQAYVDIAREGVAAFRKVPTIMPHFAGHRGPALLFARTLLRPVNCSPSLHTAAPFFLYNVATEHIPEKEPELRRYVGDIVATIIRTRMHAMIDVAFGMLLARNIVEDRVGIGFRDLESFFVQERRARDRLPYDHVYRMYHEICELARAQEAKRFDLPLVMERYFQGIGLPRVTRERSNCLYDLDKRALVYCPELRVGKGLL